jgi:hypothetical protein
LLINQPGFIDRLSLPIPNIAREATFPWCADSTPFNGGAQPFVNLFLTIDKGAIADGGIGTRTAAETRSMPSGAHDMALASGRFLLGTLIFDVQSERIFLICENLRNLRINER